MKKQITLIFAYTLVIVSVIASARALLHQRAAMLPIASQAELADCNDPPPTPNPGE